MKYLNYFNESVNYREQLINNANQLLEKIPLREINCESLCYHLLGNFKQFSVINSKIITAKEFIKNKIESTLKIGDIMSFGYDVSRHYAIYIGNGEVLESEGWGEKPKINTIENNLNDYESIMKIYRQ